MKIKIDIECDPKEARQFLGMIDFEPLQNDFIKEAQKKMKEGLGKIDMTTMMQQWLNNGLQQTDVMQNYFKDFFSSNFKK
ncbi:MAG: hypothetical protein K1X44_00705 [Alphaproteobacteria bacterium]|nr:hypothetical protein [Alphaproteobacteria bacterium]